MGFSASWPVVWISFEAIGIYSLSPLVTERAAQAIRNNFFGSLEGSDIPLHVRKLQEGIRRTSVLKNQSCAACGVVSFVLAASLFYLCPLLNFVSLSFFLPSFLLLYFAEAKKKLVHKNM